MIWFTSDTHFGHENIIRFCNRPYESLEEMDDTLLENINSLVKPHDTLYHLGDFAFNSHKQYRERIECKNVHLVLGNHDKQKRQVYEALFSTVKNLSFVNWQCERIILCHYAMRRWNGSHYGSWHLYGHSHGTLPGHGKSFDVGVDPNNYKPVSFDQVKELIEQQRYIGKLMPS